MVHRALALYPAPTLALTLTASPGEEGWAVLVYILLIKDTEAQGGQLLTLVTQLVSDVARIRIQGRVPEFQLSVLSTVPSWVVSRLGPWAPGLVSLPHPCPYTPFSNINQCDLPKCKPHLA